MTVNNNSTSTSIFQPAETFFQQAIPFGLTFDDLSLATLYSEVLPRETNLSSKISDSLELQIPIISSDMDTVTESKMAIQMALNGGMGILHYNMSDERQVKEAARVKNHIHGYIQDPITVNPNQTISSVLELIKKHNYGFSTFPVVNEENTLIGLLPGRAVKVRYSEKLVSEAMSPRESIYTLTEKEIKNDPIKFADEFFTNHLGIHKLLIVNDIDELCGLFTLSDIERIESESNQEVKPARDGDFQLICGASIAPHRKANGKIDKDRIINHVGKLVDEKIDAVAISTAHGFSKSIGEIVQLLRSQFVDLNLIAGNVTSDEGVEFLADAGANAIKVGQGPGSICTTRVVAGVGIPQMTALYSASKIAVKKNICILADGGITKSGDIVKALTLSNAVICGSLLAGCNEAPGRIIEIDGKLYKQYRGMGSHEAMKEGSASRYGHNKKDVQLKAAAEGIEALKESSGSASRVLNELIGGIQSGMGYLGASNLESLRENARYIRVTQAGQKEASPHDVITVKTSNSDIQK